MLDRWYTFSILFAIFFPRLEFVSSHTRISCNQKNAQKFFCCYFSVNICLSCIRMHSTDFDWNWFSGFLVVRRAHHERWWQLWRFEYAYLNSRGGTKNCISIVHNPIAISAEGKKVYRCEAWKGIFISSKHILTTSVTIIIHAIIIELSLLKNI